MQICFNDQILWPVITIYGRGQLVTSLKDTIMNSDREVMEIHFNPDEVSYNSMREYFKDTDNKTSVICIVDDDGHTFLHYDYVIAVKLGEEYISDDPNSHLVMQLAQLTPADKALRDNGGTKKVYTGTPLQIAIAKKKDEISAACNTAIKSGIDIGDDHYSLTAEDQTNIGTWLTFAMAGYPVPYHADGQKCHIYAADDFKVIAFSAIQYVVHHTTYCNLLTRWVEILTDITQVESVVYGDTELAGEYLEDYNNIMNNLPIKSSDNSDNAADESLPDTPVADESEGE